MKNIIVRVLLAALTTALIIYLLPQYHAPQQHAEIGKPWGYSLVVAEEDFPIYKTEKQLETERAQLLKDFAPYYKPVSENLPESYPLVISMAEASRLTQEGYTKISVLEDKTYRVYRLSEIETPKSVYAATGQEVKPTLIYDTLTNNRMREEWLAQISLTQGLVQKGERIVDQGEVVTEETYQKLISLQKARDSKALSAQTQTWHSFGEGMLVVLFVLLFVFYLYIFRPSYVANFSTLLFFATSALIIIVPSYLIVQQGWHWALYLVPFAWVPVLMRVFFDARSALFLHWIVVFIVSIVVPAPFEFLIIQMSIGMVAVASLRDMTRRAQLAQTAMWIFCAYALAYTAVTLAINGDWQAIDWHNYLFFAINSVFIIFAYGLIYIFERVFRLLSSMTLIELADFNSELLRMLAEKAPGTFQHSVQVSSLATDAAKAIGANALLVRTAALYHDIGKTVHPEFFIENQQDGVNPLLEMTPADAAARVISHVTDGEQIARKHHLPETLIYFIISHHGTSLVRYFYNTALNMGMTVDKADYQYRGPKPSTREAAILMIADAVEARSRSLKEYTEASIAEAVNRMIDAQIEDGQLDETNLSFHDLQVIRNLFKERLTAMHHHRIAYPKLNEQH